MSAERFCYVFKKEKKKNFVKPTNAEKFTWNWFTSVLLTTQPISSPTFFPVGGPSSSSDRREINRHLYHERKLLKLTKKYVKLIHVRPYNETHLIADGWQRPLSVKLSPLEDRIQVPWSPKLREIKSRSSLHRGPSPSSRSPKDRASSLPRTKIAPTYRKNSVKSDPSVRETSSLSQFFVKSTNLQL